MGRLTNITRRGAIRRLRRGRLVLWGGRRGDWQLGSERDLAGERLRNCFRYTAVLRARRQHFNHVHVAAR